MTNAVPSTTWKTATSFAFVAASPFLRTKGKLNVFKKIAVHNRPVPCAAPFGFQPRCALPLGVQVKNRLVPAVAIPAVTVPITTGIRDRVLFYLGEFFLWEPLAKVFALFIVCTICMALGSILFRAADPNRAEAKSPFWHSVRAIANPLEDDWNSVPLRFVSIVLASFGMVFFAILVGMVTDSVQATVQQADAGYTRVVAKGHTVVLGWGSRCAQTLRDFAEVSKGERVVVLAAADEQDALISEIREVIGTDKRNRLRLHYREGVPVLAEDLHRVSASAASKIVLVHPRASDVLDGDRKVISRALALRQSLPEFTGDVVAELNSKRDEDILKKIFKETKVRSIETINSEDLLFRFLAQAIRSPGLADIVDTLMGSKTSTIFHVRSVGNVAPRLKGVRYSDLRPTSIKGCLVVGYFKEDDQIELISPGQPNGPTLRENTKLLLLGTPNSEKERETSIDIPISVSEHLMKRNIHRDGNPESYLVCGWRPDMMSMLTELDKVLPKRSKLVVLDDDIVVKDIEKVTRKLKNVKVQVIVKRPDVFENLESVIENNDFDNIVLLGSALGIESSVSASGTNEDSKALATYVYVNELLQKRQLKKPGDKINTLVTIEFNNPEVATIAKDEGKVSNAILPQNLSAKIAAQTMRDSRLNSVWKELLGQKGKEVYLLPLDQYFGDGGSIQSFGTLADKAARESNHSCLGYIAGGQTKINPVGPDRVESRSWQEGDLMIVLAENDL